MPTPASVSERIRAKQKAHAKWAEDMTARLDKVDEIEAKAKPILEAHIVAQEHSAFALENDAKVMEQIAKDLSNDPSSSSQSQQGSGDAAKNEQKSNTEQQG